MTASKWYTFEFKPDAEDGINELTEAQFMPIVTKVGDASATPPGDTQNP
ncbi:MAG: hypothetical protein HY679_08620, partial [Chloroflexi bacterium]|nr:hypothetical protein [Chloroflexota bacterium]